MQWGWASTIWIVSAVLLILAREFLEGTSPNLTIQAPDNVVFLVSLVSFRLFSFVFVGLGAVCMRVHLWLLTRRLHEGVDLGR